MKWLTAVVALSISTAAFAAATTQPTKTEKKTPPAAKTAADAMSTLNTLLAPRPEEPPLQPMPDFPKENVGAMIVAPPKVAIPAAVGILKREGTIIYDRVGRLEKTPDNQQEFRFEADGAAMQDPPMLTLPNQNLMLMESAMRKASGHLKFRITGMVTEYGARNYVLIEKFNVLGDNPLAKEKQPEEQRR